MVSPRDLILFIFLLPLHWVLGKLVQPEGYHAVGSNVTLRTGYGGNDLTSVEWNHGDDNAVKWIEQNTKAYRDFEGRTFLNHTNGDLTLIGVTESESGEYTVSLNGKDSDTKLFIKVIHRVPVPTVKVNCSSEGEQRFCLYTCAGDTSQSEPVSYEWSHPNARPLSVSNKTIKVTMPLTGLPDQLFCTMRNPVSKATATTAPPTTTTAPPTSTTAPPSPPTVWNGYFFLVILAVILLPMVIWLMKGVWIWKKEIWEKRKVEGNGSPKARIEDGSPIPLLDQNKTMNNLEHIVTTQDKETAL